MLPLKGQTSAIEQLNLIYSTSIPPALLFIGPSGVGKKTAAIRFASKVTGIPVRRIENDNAVDVTGYDATLLNVESSREIERQLHWAPVNGLARIAIIDNAEKMTAPVFNSLLKILEEPPPTSHLILISSNAGRIPLTIRSRCRIVHFGSLSEEDITSILVDSLSIREQSAEQIAVVSEGSMELALLNYKGVYREDVSTVLGLLTSIRASSLETVFLEVERWNDRQQVLRRLYLAYLYFRDCFVMGTDRLYNPPNLELPLRSTLLASMKIQEAHDSIARNNNMKLALDNLILDLFAVLK